MHCAATRPASLRRLLFHVVRFPLPCKSRPAVLGPFNVILHALRIVYFLVRYFYFFLFLCILYKMTVHHRLFIDETLFFFLTLPYIIIFSSPAVTICYRPALAS